MDEAKVQSILKHWFEKRGFRTIENMRLSPGNNVDLVAQKDNEKWIVEIKGDYNSSTAQYSVNFDTGMGQILKSISKLNNKVKYAICIPFSRTERGERLSYRLILNKYSKSIAFKTLQIHLILVRDNESVELIYPEGVSSFLDTIDPAIKRR